MAAAADGAENGASVHTVTVSDDWIGYKIADVVSMDHAEYLRQLKELFDQFDADTDSNYARYDQLARSVVFGASGDGDDTLITSAKSKCTELLVTDGCLRPFDDIATSIYESSDKRSKTLLASIAVMAFLMPTLRDSGDINESIAKALLNVLGTRCDDVIWLMALSLLYGIYGKSTYLANQGGAIQSFLRSSRGTGFIKDNIVSALQIKDQTTPEGRRVSIRETRAAITPLFGEPAIQSMYRPGGAGVSESAQEQIVSALVLKEARALAEELYNSCKSSKRKKFAAIMSAVVVLAAQKFPRDCTVENVVDAAVYEMRMVDGLRQRVQSSLGAEFARPRRFGIRSKAPAELIRRAKAALSLMQAANGATETAATSAATGGAGAGVGLGSGSGGAGDEPDIAST